MTKTFALLPLAGLAVAQQYSSYPGSSLPAGVQAPSTAGFRNATIHPSYGGHAVCVSGIVPVTAATTKNQKFNFTVPQNQTGLTEVFLQFATAGSPALKQTLAGYQNVSGTYNIGATYCTPIGNTRPSAVQILTHGIGFQRSYYSPNADYSYVDVAAQCGYGVFYYDRLGVGASARPDPLNVVQTGLQIEIAAQLARSLRAGTFANTTFSKVIGVGHSFGSVITQAVTASYPSLLDAAILTGFSGNSSGIGAFVSGLNFQIARENSPYRFSGLSPGFFVSATPISAQIGFFRAPGFDPAIVAQADATKGTTTYGEWFTISNLTMPALAYNGSVAVVNGAEDLPFCTGNCTFPVDLTAAVAPMLYPKLSVNKTTSYNAPNTGHGVNLHYSANEASAFIQSFLKKQGL